MPISVAGKYRQAASILIERYRAASPMSITSPIKPTRPQQRAESSAYEDGASPLGASATVKLTAHDRSNEQQSRPDSSRSRARIKFTSAGQTAALANILGAVVGYWARSRLQSVVKSTKLEDRRLPLHARSRVSTLASAPASDCNSMSYFLPICIVSKSRLALPSGLSLRAVSRMSASAISPLALPAAIRLGISARAASGDPMS
jgi:hypothetical protein